MDNNKGNGATPESPAAPGMTVKEFADFIKAQTGKSWEEICHMLLKIGSAELKHQQALLDAKVESPIPKPLQLMISCVNQIGWGIVITKEEGQDNLNGLIIGTPDFIDNHMAKLKDK